MASTFVRTQIPKDPSIRLVQFVITGKFSTIIRVGVWCRIAQAGNGVYAFTHLSDRRLARTKSQERV